MMLGGAGGKGQDLRIDAVSFFESSDRAGVLAGTLRIDQGDGKIGLEQLGGDLAMQSSGGLEDDKLNLQVAEAGKKLCDAGIVVGQCEALAGGIEIAVEHGFGDVDADDDRNRKIAVR